VAGNYSSWLEQKQARLAVRTRRPVRQDALQRELEWIRMSPGRQSKGKADQRVQRLSPKPRRPARSDKFEITFRRARLGDRCGRRGLVKGSGTVS